MLLIPLSQTYAKVYMKWTKSYCMHAVASVYNWLRFHSRGCSGVCSVCYSFHIGYYSGLSRQI